MRKMLILITCITLMIVGCSNGTQKKVDTTSSKENESKEKSNNINESGLPILREPENFVIYVPQVSTLKEANEKQVVIDTAAETNVNIDFFEVASTSWTEKVNILFSTNSLPDAFLGAVDVGVKYHQLTPIDDYLTKEIAPNIVSFFDSRPEYWKVLKAPDGNIYSLPAGDETFWNVVDSQMWINTDWLDDVGKDIPTNIEEFYDVLVAFKEGDPNGNGDKTDEIPFTFRDIWGWGQALENAFGPFGVVESDSHVMTIDNKVSFAPAKKGYYEALKFFNKLYKEGLIDEECCTHSNDQYLSKVSATNKTYGCYINYAQPVGQPYAPVLLESKDGEKMVGINNIEKTGGFVITDACKNPEALVRWYDYINSSEKRIYRWNRGKEGQAWEFTDKYDGHTVAEITDEEVWEKEGVTSSAELRAKQAFAGNSPGFMDLSLCENYYNGGDNIKPDFNKMVIKEGIGVKAVPAGFASPENSERRALLKADIDTYLNKFVANSIINGITEDDWNKHLKSLEQLKVDEYVSLIQEYVDSKN